MLQQYGFLYNQLSQGFRRDFIAKWDVREILDFISVRGLFQKAGADTKVLVVVADAVSPRKIDTSYMLHSAARVASMPNRDLTSTTMICIGCPAALC